MITGMSSSCFYPEETEKSLIKCGELGFKNVEIFVNTYSELFEPMRNEFKSIKEYYDLNVCSIHPFTSFAESTVIFGTYPRRVDDGMEFYKKYFEFAAFLEAKFLILHGAKIGPYADNEEYFERYARLYRIGKEFGITLSQENVVLYRSQSHNFIKNMSDYLGDEFSMTLDLKQCRRAGENPSDFIEAIGSKIEHLHLSDSNDNFDCLPPFEGKTDYKKLTEALISKGYKGNYIIELYRKNFDKAQQIVEAAEKIDKILL
ncbi:MAG: sugar phosphate isomerase/epimerase [Clostridia bacterium]|nr:sugar phosphate isomerase/epimerase [Clostridia bacterium]